MSSIDFKHNNRPIDLQLGHYARLDVAVLAADLWGYVDAHLQQSTAGTPESRTNTRFFWRQAERFAAGLASERYESRPLHLYYMMLNATKALLLHRDPGGSADLVGATLAGKKEPHKRSDLDWHGLSYSAKDFGENQLPGQVDAVGKGVFTALRAAIGDKAGKATYRLEDLMASVVSGHRAYCTVRNLSAAGEKFIPLRGPYRVRHVGDGYVFFEGHLPKHIAVADVEKSVPAGLEAGAYPGNGDAAASTPYIREKSRRKIDFANDADSFAKWHATNRRRVHLIAGQGGVSYYVCRQDNPVVPLSQLSLNFAIGLSLSSLARYHPDIIHNVLDREDGWLLKEYLCTAPAQFLALIAGEITGRIIQRPYSDLR